jgi:hypothetical protein
MSGCLQGLHCYGLLLAIEGAQSARVAHEAGRAAKHMTNDFGVELTVWKGQLFENTLGGATPPKRIGEITCEVMREKFQKRFVRGRSLASVLGAFASRQQ